MAAFEPASRYELAQVNYARLRAPMLDPATAGFVENLDRINALADSQPGFVWRPTDKEEHPGNVIALDDPMDVLNLSVWRDAESLAAFVYRTAHLEVMKRRREWFEHTEVYMALWWIPAGRRPTVGEALERLETLRRMGPSPEAFTFRDRFAPPGDADIPPPILEECA
jgi:hypothetical protein